MSLQKQGFLKNQIHFYIQQLMKHITETAKKSSIVSESHISTNFTPNLFTKQVLIFHNKNTKPLEIQFRKRMTSPLGILSFHLLLRSSNLQNNCNRSSELQNNYNNPISQSLKYLELQICGNNPCSLHYQKSYYIKIVVQSIICVYGLALKWVS